MLWFDQALADFACILAHNAEQNASLAKLAVQSCISEALLAAEQLAASLVAA
jgi:hypothetical protein